MGRMPPVSAIWVAKGSPAEKLSFEELCEGPVDAIYIVRRQTEREESQDD